MLARTTKSRPMEKAVKNVSRNCCGDGKPMGKFCRLTVIRFVRVAGRLTAECKCDCGNMKTTRYAHLTSGGVKSCGCLKRESSRRTGLANTRHGHSSPATRSHTYRSWESMKARCSNPKDPSFVNYGARGIIVCKRWVKFENFLADMGERPRGTTLDRLEVNGNYSPLNCRWSVPRIQQRNKRTNRLVEFNGNCVPLVVVAEQSGIPYHRLWERIVRRGWTVQDAINKPSTAYV